ncbi:FxsA family protein [Pseudomonas petrae]|uniref:Membrane protein FxsA n=1 Tax=Pseudomonas petrae TaxID=2912190 RepID=A0ABS9I3G9_9PSED|nr:FxsA family protein [Pseudomonas petrae]MCF7533140.1 membrane protein FxsA [Pseudomonas petrae]MCF7538614.1 membrane protein FxsA [Pseudomonas petrae]MCF7541551.1 membrane protein FxsA [Pseudomonas petrae]MCF7556031.1 membrane protein FxsA [Pseudomonas petrae]
MRVFLLLLLLFPVLELFVLVKVGMSIGFLPTFLLVVAGSMLGVFVVRIAGVATALSARQSLARGELPAQQMLNGLMMTIGGGLLVLPGFISDVLGLLFLMPFTRRMIVGKVRNRAEAQAARQRAFAENMHAANSAGSMHPGAARPEARRPEVIEGEVIEGEYEPLDKK